MWIFQKERSGTMLKQYGENVRRKTVTVSGCSMGESVTIVV